MSSGMNEILFSIDTFTMSIKSLSLSKVTISYR